MTPPKAPEKFVSYVRVSTGRQGASGLGLAAQHEAVTGYVESQRGVIVKEYREVESGRQNARPELAKALHHAKVTGATLVIAKLDRLSRNAAFLMNLAESGVKFVAADMPGANTLTVGVMALVAQQEAEAISNRTRDALRAAKARGQVLGNPNGAQALRKARKGNRAAVTVIKEKADLHAASLKPDIESLKAEGVTSLGALAAALNKRGILTPRGGRWHKTSVSNLIARWT